MRIPAPPPDARDLLAQIQGAGRLATVIEQALPDGAPPGRYLPWDRFRFKNPPGDLTVEEWWFAVRLARRSVHRPIKHLRSTTGRPFSYALPDEVLVAVDQITREASGHITIFDEVTNPATRDRYVVNSLIEEAITSSQIEGAATTRRVAKEMLRVGRAPRDHSERMIFNSYLAMQRIGELRDADLTPELVCEIHRIITDGTLENPSSAGRMQTHDAERIAVHNTFGALLHARPAAAELPERMRRLCEFANGGGTDHYLPPVLRAVTVHFMVGHDNYFEGGNGRTARALFYWTMLRNGYWLVEFLSISRLLQKASSQYGRSFLLTETDEGDLTHFFIHHVGVINRAIAELHRYLANKAAEIRELNQSLTAAPGIYNHRQLALLDRALKEPSTWLTVRGHATSHQVSGETARQDLMDLEQRGLLHRGKSGRQFAWAPVEDLHDRLIPHPLPGRSANQLDDPRPRRKGRHTSS
ncbi:Fic family protein [Nocardioides alcanivorans]|uniref:Fic family protein n=1 Tax=Nocardioides alcanivorans TaxID=2897352 RepID=UPI001F2B5467|nr:Fic family protein [Nocardioides alcanivorans]